MDQSKLHEIDEQLTKSEVAALKFLCIDYIGKKRLETVKDAKDLFIRLSEQSMLEDILFLSDLLYTIARYDLLSILGTNKKDVERLLQNQTSGVSKYRKMLYELSEDVTDDHLHDIKFLLKGLPKAKLASATFLDVLTEMEKMEMLGEDNLDELYNVLSKCSKDLAYKVQKFKNTNGTRIHDHISVQDQEVSLSISEQEESSDLPVPLQEESNSLPAPNQDEPFNQSDVMQNMSIECHESTASLPTRSGSLSGSESTVVTDSRGPTSERGNDYYPMTHRPRGYCLIINNYIFDKHTNLRKREGTDVDKDELTRVFSRMHFFVIERRDLRSSDLMDTMKEFAEIDHSEMDAFVCCILSHGLKGAVCGIDGKAVQIHELTQLFTQCQTLIGKPKLFFIQACQGTELQQGVWRQDGSNMEDEEYEDDAEKPARIPYEADFLIGMATVQFYKSFRHTSSGSIYIQELCRQLKKGCPNQEDILSILTKVNFNVSKKELNGKKQMPEPRYTLTRKLVLPMD